jgi:hypothetical protein
MRCLSSLHPVEITNYQHGGINRGDPAGKHLSCKDVCPKRAYP